MGLDLNVSLYSIIIVTIVLIASTITDLKKRVIEPWLCLALVLAAFIDQPKDYAMSLLGLAVGFIPFFLMAIAGNGGGGDALLAGAVGWSTHLYLAAYTLLGATFLYAFVLLIVVIVTKDKKKQLPFAPFMLSGWLLSLFAII